MDKNTSETFNDGGAIVQKIAFIVIENLTTTSFEGKLENLEMPENKPVSNTGVIITLSIIFCLIASIGLFGNTMVIYVILSDNKMRRSVTNLFILNLGIADLLIMLFGVPEITQFMLNHGWILGSAMCKFDRFMLVVSLYASIQTLVAVCVERYIAIVHPIKAHIMCSRRRVLNVIWIIWLLSIFAGLPTAIFNQLVQPHPSAPPSCRIMFPGRNAIIGYTTFKLLEFILFFLAPVVIQIVLYIIISKRLFVNTTKLHRSPVRHSMRKVHPGREIGAIRARKGVVKMLIATVIVYTISYTPVQVPLFYNMATAGGFKPNFAFIVLIMSLAYINSAANPILYSIFSQKFRKKFKQVLCRHYNKYSTPQSMPGCSMDVLHKSARTLNSSPGQLRFTSVKHQPFCAR